MFDLGRSFLATVERSPDAVAIVDGARRLELCRLVCARFAASPRGLAGSGCARGDRLAVMLQNRLEMASLHWACQFLGVVVTPLNWRIKADELDYCLADAEAARVVFDAVAAEAVAGRGQRREICRAWRSAAPKAGAAASTDWHGRRARSARGPAPRICRLLLYTSGTTGRPKGVPRRHRAERAAALAHVAQNLYAPRRAHAWA